jgi:hypothetical protein
MRLRFFRKRRRWGEPEDQTDFVTTWLLICTCVLAVVVVCQQ